MQGIEPLFYDNCEKNITFKYCEPLFWTPKTYIKLYIIDNSVFLKREKKNITGKKKKKSQIAD